MGFGCISSLFYLFFVNEVKLVEEAKEYDAAYKKKTFGENSLETKKIEGGSKTPIDWLKDWNFWLHGLVYTMVRVA